MWWPLHHGHLTWLSIASALTQCHQLSSVTPATHTQTYHVYSLVAKELGYWTNNILWIWIPGPWRASNPTIHEDIPHRPNKGNIQFKAWSHSQLLVQWFQSYGLFWPVKSYDFGLKLQTATSALSLVTGYLSLVTGDRSPFKDDHHSPQPRTLPGIGNHHNPSSGTLPGYRQPPQHSAQNYSWYR